jgi:hypothetical protein
MMRLAESLRAHTITHAAMESTGVYWKPGRAKQSYLRAQFNRLAARRGVKKAVVAVAASILASAYFILRDDVSYRGLGPDYLDRRDPGNVARRLAKRIEALVFRRVAPRSVEVS